MEVMVVEEEVFGHITTLLIIINSHNIEDHSPVTSRLVEISDHHPTTSHLVRYVVTCNMKE